jgi:hypothetical protein
MKEDDFSKAQALMKLAKIDSPTIAKILHKMSSPDSQES